MADKKSNAKRKAKREFDRVTIAEYGDASPKPPKRLPVAPVATLYIEAERVREKYKTTVVERDGVKTIVREQIVLVRDRLYMRKPGDKPFSKWRVFHGATAVIQRSDYPEYVGIEAPLGAWIAAGYLLCKVDAHRDMQRGFYDDRRELGETRKRRAA